LIILYEKTIILDLKRTPSIHLTDIPFWEIKKSYQTITKTMATHRWVLYTPRLWPLRR